MSLSARKFVVGLAGPSDPVSRASRRVIIHVDVLKAAKVSAGDVLALSRADNIPGHKKVLAISTMPWQNLSR